MVKSTLVIISTAHLHPLEAERIDNVSYMSCSSANLISTDEISCNSYESEAGLYCLADLARAIRSSFGADYIIFDADAEVHPIFRKYDW